MSMRVKLHVYKAQPPNSDSHTASSPGSNDPVRTSRAPTPATEQPSTSLTSNGPAILPKQRKHSRPKKRDASDNISPAAKRVAHGAAALARRLSIKPPTAPQSDGEVVTPGGHKIKLPPRKPSGPAKRLTINATRRPPPPRLPGHGYDSEDSDAEKDPAIQQGIILRMPPDSPDADYLHQAIAAGKIGLPMTEGGAQVSLKFITSDYRRAIVRVRGTVYAAVLVDLPCVVEAMKSWDKKSWWKNADICQMLLVLGAVRSEDEAKSYPLPREVNHANFQYAHGLTPPMHWVRKRRFRPRRTKTAMADVEEEVQRLMRADRDCEDFGGETVIRETTRGEYEREQAQRERQGSLDDGDAMDTTEPEGNMFDVDYFNDDIQADLEAGLQDAFNEITETPDTPDVTGAEASPGPGSDPAPASFDMVTDAPLADSPAGASPEGETPQRASTDQPYSDGDEEDEDDEDDDASPRALDEDAEMRAAEKRQQMEEVEDLEREIAAVRAKANNMTNQLLKQRELGKLRALEEDLRVKRDAFGLDAED